MPAVGLPFSLRRVRVTGVAVPAGASPASRAAVAAPSFRCVQPAAPGAVAPPRRLDRQAQRADRPRHQAALPSARLRAAYPEPEGPGQAVRSHRRAGSRRFRAAECDRHLRRRAQRQREPHRRGSQALRPARGPAPSPPHRRLARRREPSLQVSARGGFSLRRRTRGARSGGALLVTPSRRTRPDSLARLARAIADVPHFVWDGAGDNPYFALLGLADAIVVTEDSVNMVTEAAGTGKPVYVQSLQGRSARLARFHRLMRERGATRPSRGDSNHGPTPRSTTPSLWRPPFAAP